MALYSEPPRLHPFSEDKPTLLVCWWITTFCTVIILLRLAGRLVRTERLFREDKTAALALVPLFLRMGCVHVILVYGTNNAQLADAGLSDEDLHRRSIASGLVLLSRVLYAATLWILKYAILEFFRRLNVNWERSYEVSLVFVRTVLITTFIAVVISDLAECQPFSHYWQVLPDPGGQCRQGYAQLLTMAICNVLTDLLLVVFPVPVILGSSMSTKRKFHLVLLFSLSLAPVAVTLYRVPHIIQDHGSQQRRSLYASIELLFATAAANALVLGSFVRDRGVKKRRFKYESVAAGSLERSSASESRRPTVLKHWGSDEDLVRDMGYGLKPELRDSQLSPADARQYVPAPVAKLQEEMRLWQFPGQKRTNAARSDDAGDRVSSIRSNSTATRRVSFFDYGGLLDDQPRPTSRRESGMSSDRPTPAAAVPEPAVPASMNGFRRGSAALLQDLGGFLMPPGSKTAKPARPKKANNNTTRQPIRRSQTEAPSAPSTHSDDRRTSAPELIDVGGLLDTPSSS
ncbi:Rhodopsin domain-containing protein [Madurella fahalii]|uniref:Rhodopsin domain-containing protein n=1 Tax=Madurella fahalii TaxID=1157608 RepID=A0ABQ0GM26_9PEZI